MQIKTLLTLPLLLTLASPVLADDDKALLAKCDMDRNGVINGPANDLPPADWAMVEKERVCMREYEIDQLAKTMPDIRHRCDLNGNGRIDHPEPLTTPILMSGTETNGKKAWRSLPEAVRKEVDVEQKCVMDASIAQSRAEATQSRAEATQSRAEATQNRAEIAKLDEILALLNPAEAKAALVQDISKTEQLLKQARDRNNHSAAQRHEARLRELKERQKALK